MSRMYLTWTWCFGASRLAVFDQNVKH